MRKKTLALGAFGIALLSTPFIQMLYENVPIRQTKPLIESIRSENAEGTRNPEIILVDWDYSRNVAAGELNTSSPSVVWRPQIGRKESGYSSHLEYWAAIREGKVPVETWVRRDFDRQILDSYAPNLKTLGEIRTMTLRQEEVRKGNYITLF